MTVYTGEDWGKGNIPSLLVGVQTFIVTLEIQYGDFSENE